jgi:hypothetical protein
VQYEIVRLERDIIVAEDEKKIHEEDLRFHLELIQELGGFDNASDEDSEIEIINKPAEGAKITKAEKQEAKDKARAWHLYRKREKERKEKKTGWGTSGPGKENIKNAGNTGGWYKGTKKFQGRNTNLQGKIFEISAKDAVHQFTETVKANADFVGQEYTHGGDIQYMIKNMADYNFVRPADPPANANEYDKESWKKQVDLFWKHRGIYMDNKMKLYSLIWGQSSKRMQSKLETHLNFSQCKNDYDSLGLLKIIREFVFKSDNCKYKYKAEDQAKRAFYNLRQTPEMGCQEYFERIRNVVDVIKSLG